MLTLLVELLSFQVCSWAQGRESTWTCPSAPKIRERKVRVVKTMRQHLSSSQPAKSVLQLSFSAVTTSGILQNYQVMESMTWVSPRPNRHQWTWSCWSPVIFSGMENTLLLHRWSLLLSQKHRRQKTLNSSAFYDLVDGEWPEAAWPVSSQNHYR